MPEMPSLELLPRQWENNEEIRQRLRERKGLLWKEAWEDKVKIDVYHAAENFCVLSHLSPLLLDSDGAVGMHNVPEIQRAFLGNP